MVMQMRLTKKRMSAAAVGTFGAALATIYTAPELQADIIGLTFSQNSVAYGASVTNVLINEVGVSFTAWNVSAPFEGVSTFGNAFSGGLGVVQASQTLTSGFTAATGINYLASGKNFVGFHHNGGAGWFSVTVNSGGAMTWGPGEWGGTDGTPVHVGGTNPGVPEPSSLAALGLLALGATGVRRKRKK